MKKTKGKKDTIVTGEGTSRGARKQRLLRLWLPVAVLVVLVGGVAAWHFMHGPKPLTPQQQSAKNSLSSQQQNIQQQSQANAPDDVKAASYSNLAESYAVAGQCEEAKNALRQAQQIAPADMQKDLNDTANTVGKYC